MLRDQISFSSQLSAMTPLVEQGGLRDAGISE